MTNKYAARASGNASSPACGLVPLTLSGGLSALLFGLVLHFCRFGIDFADEGFYINWLTTPSKFHFLIPTSFFGFIYHPLYTLLGGDITALRRANAVITGLLALALSYQALDDRPTTPAEERSPVWLRLGYACAIAIVSMLALSWVWLPTPNYNTLTFQSLTLTMLGVLKLCAQERRQQSLGIILTAIGGCLTFLAKPSSAALLAPLTVIYITFAGRVRLRDQVLCGAGAALLLAVFAVIVDGSLAAFAERFGDSVTLLRALGSGQEISKLFRLGFPVLTKTDVRYVVPAVLFAVAGATALQMPSKWPRVLAGVACGVLASAAGILIARDVRPAATQTSVLFLVPILSAAALFLLRRDLWRTMNCRVPLSRAALFLTMPYVYAFGTSNDYWYQSGAAAYFWVLSAAMLLWETPGLRARKLAILPLLIVCQVLTGILVNHSIDHPYRQPESLRRQSALLAFNGGGNLLISSTYRDYVLAARAVAARADFVPGTPMIDLTGHTPGLLAALGGLPLGQPWLVGGYPGSNKLAVTSLAGQSCESLIKAWLLTEPGGPFALSDSKILSGFGAKLKSDYTIVGKFDTATFPGGSDQPHTQYLLRPSRPTDTALQACKRTANLRNSQEIIQ